MQARIRMYLHKVLALYLLAPIGARLECYTTSRAHYVL